MVATAMELMRTTTLDKRAILCIYLLLTNSGALGARPAISGDSAQATAAVRTKKPEAVNQKTELPSQH
jgi:hypothetical protein